jgi:hypothetical protein
MNDNMCPLHGNALARHAVTFCTCSTTENNQNKQDLQRKVLEVSTPQSTCKNCTFQESTMKVTKEGTCQECGRNMLDSVEVWKQDLLSDETVEKLYQNSWEEEFDQKFAKITHLGKEEFAITDVTGTKWQAHTENGLVTQVGGLESIKDFIRTEIQKAEERAKERAKEREHEDCIKGAKVATEHLMKQVRLAERTALKVTLDAYAQFVADVLDGVKPEEAYKTLNGKLQD